MLAEMEEVAAGVTTAATGETFPGADFKDLLAASREEGGPGRILTGQQDVFGFAA